MFSVQIDLDKDYSGYSRSVRLLVKRLREKGLTGVIVVPYVGCAQDIDSRTKDEMSKGAGASLVTHLLGCVFLFGSCRSFLRLLYSERSHVDTT